MGLRLRVLLWCAACTHVYRASNGLLLINLPPEENYLLLKGSMAVSWKMATLDLAAAVLAS